MLRLWASFRLWGVIANPLKETSDYNLVMPGRYKL